MKINRHIIFFALFCAVLLYGGWLYLGHFQQLWQENRLKRTNPIIPANVSTAYENALTQVLSEEDHFALQGLSKLKRGLLNTSFTHRVEIGKDDWLFIQEEVPGRPAIQQSLGVFQYTPYQLKIWQLLFRQRHAWTEANGMKYMLVLTPNKATIYPENLPSRYHFVGAGTREQLQEALPDVYVVDLTDSIRQHKDKGILFLKNDTHWNELAAFYGYQALMYAMPDGFRAQPLSLTDCAVAMDTAHGGDLARLMLEDEERWEIAPFLEPLQSNSVFIEDRSGSIAPGLTPKVYVNEQATLPKVLFDHDSFLKICAPSFPSTTRNPFSFGDGKALMWGSFKEKNPNWLSMNLWSAPSLAISHAMNGVLFKITGRHISPNYRFWPNMTISLLNRSLA